ncbi:MAG TPA: hypothetical protein VGT02_03445 [Methylomirabilota bacterium]|nr:hypothetical protein [Methylomirabilota bacterium]
MKAVVAAFPDVVLALAFLITWIAPSTLGPGMVSSLTLLMLLEFINVHSAGLMGIVLTGAADTTKKVKLILGLGALYTLFVVGMALAFKTWWPLTAFWLLTLNRLLPTLLRQAPTGQERYIVTVSWVAGCAFYLFFVCATTLLPLPRFGTTRGAAGGSGSGLWIDEPHRALAFGFLYFTAVAALQLSTHRWVGKIVEDERGAGAGA